jgi:hypothetical protein
MFRENLDRCIELARRERVVLMCAEALPWRCHRSLIADALLVRNIEASEITSRVRTRPHSLTTWARVTGIQVTYPAAGAPPGQSERLLRHRNDCSPGSVRGKNHVPQRQEFAGLPASDGAIGKVDDFYS